MKNFEKTDFNYLAEHLYASCHTPVYHIGLREGTWKILSCYPESVAFLGLPFRDFDQYAATAFSAECSLQIRQVEDYFLFGILLCRHSGDILLMGPACPVWVTGKMILDLLSTYARSAETITKEGAAFINNTGTFGAFSPEELWDLMLTLNMSINHESVTPDQELFVKKQLNSINMENYEKAFTSLQKVREEERFHQGYLLEKQFQHLIETGNIDGIEAFSHRARKLNLDHNLAADPLRQEKNMGIISTVLSSRSATLGGMDAALSLSLAESYILRIENLSDIEQVRKLCAQIPRDYCVRVSRHRQIRYKDPLISGAISYVQAHTNSHLSTEDVANALGVSRSCLSKRFSREMGFSLSAFIRACKLEEARFLLQYTTQTISEISYYLFFSSQSHFQKAFREHFGVTPAQYRRHPELQTGYPIENLRKHLTGSASSSDRHSNGSTP